jgi:hypothetical protein
MPAGFEDVGSPGNTGSGQLAVRTDANDP